MPNTTQTTIANDTVGVNTISTSVADGIFVVPDHVNANATTSATYNMSTQTATGTSSSVKYDYVFDYTLDATQAANFCNAFDVSGANPYNQAENARTTARLLTGSAAAVKAILEAALEDASSNSVQVEEAGAQLTQSISEGEKIDAMLTKRLNYIINNVLDSEFDAGYYAAAVAGDPGAPAVHVNGQNIDIAYDADSGVAALQRAAAADAAVLDISGTLDMDATLLATQIPGTNLALYAGTDGRVPRSLLLKGGDTVVLAFSITLNSTTVTSGFPVVGTNSGAAANSHPETLSAATLTVTNSSRPVEVAVRLHMPGNGTALSNVPAA